MNAGKNFKTLLCFLALIPWTAVLPAVAAPGGTDQHLTLSKRPPLAEVHDEDYDRASPPAARRSGTRVPLPLLPAGRPTLRRLTLLNREAASGPLQVRVEPALFYVSGASKPLPVLSQTIYLAKGGRKILSFSVPTPNVPKNTLLVLTLRVRRAAQGRFMTRIAFVLTPLGAGGTQAVFIGRDDKTQGNWRTVYGREGFYLPIQNGTATFAAQNIRFYRGSGQAPIIPDNPLKEPLQEYQLALDFYDKARFVDDPRVPLGGNGLTTRDTVAFATRAGFVRDRNPKIRQSHAVQTPLIMRIETTDGASHQLSLYCLDYHRQHHVLQISLYDQQWHLLDYRQVTRYEEGAYMKYRIVGSVMAIFTTPDITVNPSLQAVFVDPTTSEGLLQPK